MSELLIDRIGRPRLMVVGDLMLDRHVYGRCTLHGADDRHARVDVDQVEVFPGGAAKVCQQLAALGCDVLACGVVGQDAEGRMLLERLEAAGVAVHAVKLACDRPTTVKERIFAATGDTHHQQMLRIDRETRTPTSIPIPDVAADMILVSDYGKGVCTNDLIRHVRRSGTPWMVDPARGADWSLYRRATAVKCNFKEAIDLIGEARTLVTARNMPALASMIASGFGFGACVITSGGSGMSIGFRTGYGLKLPQKTHHSSAPGAGDVVLALMGAGVASGLDLVDACRLANLAAGIYVRSAGEKPVTRDQLRHPFGTGKVVPLEDLKSNVGQMHIGTGKVVYANGCFDVLHLGHVAMLLEAAAQGDLLIVGINSDASVRAIKGEGRPIQSLEHRVKMLSALNFVNYIVPFDEPTPIKHIEVLEPDVLVKGGDYRDRADQIPGRELVERRGGKVHFARYVEGVSTTQIVASMRPQPCCPASGCRCAAP